MIVLSLGLLVGFPGIWVLHFVFIFLLNVGFRAFLLGLMWLFVFVLAFSFCCFLRVNAAGLSCGFGLSFLFVGAFLDADCFDWFLGFIGILVF